MNWEIPLADLDLGPEEETAALEVLRRGWLTMGTETREFEREFAAFTRAKHAIAVANCTAALHLACLALGLRSGDEVIVPSLTFVATANAVRYTGARPVFADITSATDLCIAPHAIAAKITPRTRAIIVMHYAGYACDMVGILALAEQHGLPVIEDAAHAPGAELDGRALGTRGTVGCFSFFSNKNMTTGEGGMIVCADDALAERFRRLRSHGMTSLTWDRHKGHAWSYDVVDEGYNYRLDEIRSAIGRVQLKKLNANNEQRRALDKQYVEMFLELLPEATVPFTEYRGISSHHIRPLLLPEGSDRAHFMEAMKKAGIQTSIHYPPIHQFTSYLDQRRVDHLPLTELVASREVTLPLYPGMASDSVTRVVEAARAALRSQSI